MLGTGEQPAPTFSERLRSIEQRLTSAVVSPSVQACAIDVVRGLRAWAAAATLGGPEAEGIRLVVAADLRRLGMAIDSANWADAAP